jgi:hypothetical protein
MASERENTSEHSSEIDRLEREAIVVRRLRRCIGFVLAFGVFVIVLGYVPIRTIDVAYREQIGRAGSDELSLFVVLLLLPAGWVYRKPRWPQLVVWIMWITSWLMLLAIFSLGSPDPMEGDAELGWVRTLIICLLALMGACVVIVMPLIRWTHKAPSPPRRPDLPSARIVR